MRAILVMGLLVLAVVLPAATLAAAEGDTDSAFTDRLKEIRLIEIQHLRPAAPTEFEKGRQKILAMRDEDAIGPMVNVLYGTNDRYRGILLEALAGYAARDSKVAKAYLQDMAVGDGSTSHRRRAVDGLKGVSGTPPTERLMAHLALDEVPVFRDRAATALAALDHRQAVWLLVERLVSEDVKMVGGEQWVSSMQMDIRVQSCSVPTFRQSTISAAVPGMGIATATIDLPEVHVVDVATTIAMTDRGKMIPHYQRVRTEHAEVLTALRQLTGKDFGFNQAAWQKWLQSDEAAKTVPPWSPVIIKPE